MKIIISIACLLIGATIVNLFIVRLKPVKIEMSQKMKECVEAGGKFDIYDLSWKKDGSNYTAVCSIPEHDLWEMEIK